MKTLRDLEKIEEGKTAIIMGAGSSVKEYSSNIEKLLEDENNFIIGINNVLFVPKYHLWTNSSRFRTFGKNISPVSKILLGQNIPLKLINEVIGKREYTLINYTDKEGNPINYRKGKIEGFFRTAGVLAIMLSHIMGAKNIFICGMDGYSLYSEEELKAKTKSQHSYGVGHTDTADYETCVFKDKLINNNLLSLRKYGIKFSIITPTKYKDFYDNSILGKRIENDSDNM